METRTTQEALDMEGMSHGLPVPPGSELWVCNGHTA